MNIVFESHEIVEVFPILIKILNIVLIDHANVNR